MDNKNVLKGVIYVALGASFYGMLATFVKIAYQNDYTTAEVTTAQILIGIVGVFLLSMFQGKVRNKSQGKATRKDIIQLLLAGTSYGGTSLTYYLAVQYLDVSIAIVLLMQSVWLSVLVESVMQRSFPSWRKIIATIIVLVGTLFATNTIGSEINLHPRGVFWGMMAAVSYTVTMFTANKIANHLAPPKKSFIMLLGGSVLVFSFLFFSQVGPTKFVALQEFYEGLTGRDAFIKDFDFSIFYTYGLFLGLFGTIIPPIFLNKGFPLAGLGLGSIVSSIELPVSVTIAYLLLSEQVLLVQWFGIVLILGAIVLMNLGAITKRKF